MSMQNAWKGCKEEAWKRDAVNAGRIKSLALLMLYLTWHLYHKSTVKVRFPRPNQFRERRHACASISFVHTSSDEFS